jgi:hypothetical protein
VGAASASVPTAAAASASTAVGAPTTSTTPSAARSRPAAIEHVAAVFPTTCTALQPPAELLPFPGSTELSDGTTMAYFPWLQRQLRLLQRAQSGGASSTAATTGSGGGPGAVAAGRTEGNGKAVVARDRLTSEQVARLQVLLEKGVTVLRWAATT